MLRVDRLSFRYGTHPVLSEVSFDAQAGEMVAVLGPNGSGKSTLLRCLNRILRPHEGEVRLGQERLETFSCERLARTVAYVPQRLETAPLSVFEAVLLGRKPYFTWTAAASDLHRVETALLLLGLDSLARRPTDRLSGGETQKVALARALVQEPKLLLLDEPTSALDLRNQVELLRLLRAVVREQQLVALLCLHDINLALRYADRFLLLREGRLIGDVRYEGLTPEMIEQVYGIPVEIHASDRGFSFIIEKPESPDPVAH